MIADRIDGLIIEQIRVFRATGTAAGVAYDLHAWFVFDRGRHESSWHKHGGPYSTREQAVWWINAIRDDPDKTYRLDKRAARLSDRMRE